MENRTKITQEEKQLLFQDLSARLPYGVNVKIINKDNVRRVVTLTEGNIAYVKELTNGWWKECKPYLRSMSSMTEEEARDYSNCGNVIAFSPQKDYLIPNPNSTDWLNKNHFDYRGLIPMGLAIVVTKENNPYK